MPKKPTYFQERKDFLYAMMPDGPAKNQWRKEMGFTKKIFEDWPVEFLKTVKPPFAMNSVAWFLGAKGKEFLSIKLKEFRAKPQEIIESKVVEKKVGADGNVQKKISIANFLDE